MYEHRRITKEREEEDKIRFYTTKLLGGIPHPIIMIHCFVEEPRTNGFVKLRGAPHLLDTVLGNET